MPKAKSKWRRDYLHRPPARNRHAGHSDHKLPDIEACLPNNAPGGPPGSEDPLRNTRQRGVLPRAGSHGHLQSEERDQVSHGGTPQDRASSPAPHLAPPQRPPPRRSEPDAAGPEDLAGAPSATPPWRARPPPTYPLWRPARSKVAFPRGCARTLGPLRLRYEQLGGVHTATARGVMGARARY